VLLLALITLVVESKKPIHSSVGTQPWKTRKRLCELGECKASTISDPNCVFRCVSPECFRTVFEESPIGLMEPGEVDITRDRQFQTCALKQDSDAKKEQAIQKKTKGKAPPADPSKANSDAGPGEAERTDEQA